LFLGFRNRGGLLFFNPGLKLGLLFFLHLLGDPLPSFTICLFKSDDGGLIAQNFLQLLLGNKVRQLQVGSGDRQRQRADAGVHREPLRVKHARKTPLRDGSLPINEQGACLWGVLEVPVIEAMLVHVCLIPISGANGAHILAVKERQSLITGQIKMAVGAPSARGAANFHNETRDIARKRRNRGKKTHFLRVKLAANRSMLFIKIRHVPSKVDNTMRRKHADGIIVLWT
jgi:hypothetical protein